MLPFLIHVKKLFDCVVLWIASCSFKSHNYEIYKFGYLLDTRRVNDVMHRNFLATLYEYLQTSL
jgi:hypothetical protein